MMESSLKSFRLTALQPAGRRLIRATVIIICVLYGPLAHAWVTGVLRYPNNVGTNFNLSLGSTVTVPRDAAIQTQLARVRQNPGLGATGLACRITERISVNGSAVPGMPGYYKTNLRGVAVRFRKTKGRISALTAAPYTANFSFPNMYNGSQNIIEAALFVVGPVESGTLTNLPSMTVQFTGSCMRTVTRTVTISPGTRVMASSCTVTTPSVSVPLPPVAAERLQPVGTLSAESASFNINLTCPTGIDVYVTLTDVTAPGNRTNNLTLTTDSTARGVALRLSHGTTAVSFGADSSAANNPGQWTVGASSATTAVPLTARYVSTGTVTPGTVNALATFTMSYR